jgi:hypothetical protein
MKKGVQKRRSEKASKTSKKALLEQAGCTATTFRYMSQCGDPVAGRGPPTVPRGYQGTVKDRDLGGRIDNFDGHPMTPFGVLRRMGSSTLPVDLEASRADALGPTVL